MQFDRVVSLGGRCDVSWQIRRRTGVETTLPFDWTITPLSSLVSLLDSGFDSLLEADNIRVVYSPSSNSNFQSLMDAKYNWCLHHEFSRDDTGRISKEFGNELPKVKEKFNNLANRFLDLLASGQNILFVRRGADFQMPSERAVGNNGVELQNLHECLRSRVTGNFKILALNCNAGDSFKLPENIVQGAVRGATANEWADLSLRWRGSISEYDREFDKFLPR